MINTGSMKIVLSMAVVFISLGLAAQVASANEQAEHSPTSPATPGDVKTSNDDSGMKPDEAAHEKIIENNKPVKTH